MKQRNNKLLLGDISAIVDFVICIKISIDICDVFVVNVGTLVVATTSSLLVLYLASELFWGLYGI